LLIRYRRSEDGKAVARALVYTQEEHRIDRSRVDPDALRIVERLRENGHEAYIVGGAVRDLLLDRKPKDFDIVTDAQPPRIKRIFRSARVIGRRFRLVHVYAGPQIFEVSTFRSIANGTVGNEYGSIDEDALRRDFTMNALYYDPVDQLLVDYVGGFKDIGARRVKPVIPLATIFKEDPVRMIRCVKYAATSSCRIPLLTRMAVRRDAALLAAASPSRLTEEFVKILGSGKAERIFHDLWDFGLLARMLPEAASCLASGSAFRRAFLAELALLDAYAVDPGKEKRLAVLLSHFLKPFLEKEGVVADTPDSYREALLLSRDFLAPLNPPRIELEAAVLVIFRKLGVSPLQRPRRQGPERGRGESRFRGEPRQREESPGAMEGAPPRPGERRDASPAPEEGAAGEPRPKRRRRRKPGAAAGNPVDETGGEPSMAAAGAPGKAGPAGGRVADSPTPEGSEPAKRRRRRRRKPSAGGQAADGL
jgi:poly(A) polymerase